MGMIETFIKNASLIFCCLYLFDRLIGYNSKKRQLVRDLIFIAGMAGAVLPVRLYFQLLVVPVLIAVLVIYIALFRKTALNITITVSILSYGISYVLFLTSSFLVAVIFHYVGIDHVKDEVKYGYVCIAIFQNVLAYLIFKIRRFKSGMPFLKNKIIARYGAIISVGILLCSEIISNINQFTPLHYAFPVLVAAAIGACIMFWWQAMLKHLYLEKLKKDEVNWLKAILRDKDEELRDLKLQNEYLSKVIHKDNKLLPAMELAVTNYLQALDTENIESARERGIKYANEIKTLTEERFGILSDYQATCSAQPMTGLVQVDTIITYMMNKAAGYEMKLDAIFMANMKNLVDQCISESKLCTLLADLIENAIIAVKFCEKKSILVSFSMIRNAYVLDIFDSGIPFDSETVRQFGRARTTTHAAAGGTGIGIMTTFDILRSCRASFIIEEVEDIHLEYTKKVTVRFDGKCRYVVRTSDSEVIRSIDHADLDAQ